MAADIAVSATWTLVEKVLSRVDKIRKIPRTVRDDLEKARDCLQTMDAYLMASQKRIDQAGNQELLQARVKQVRDAADEIEDAVDEFMLQVPHHSQYTHWYSWLPYRPLKASSKFSSRIEDIIQNKIGFIRVLDSIHQDGLPQDGQPTSSTSHHGGTLTPQVLEDDEIVGFDEHKKILIAQLIKRKQKRQTISIVGPGGSGKTTIMRNVYDTKKVQKNFDCQAWIDVLRPLNLDNVLRNMLRNFDPKGKWQEPVLHEETNYLKEKLRELLKQKKFLVVMDNVWSNQDLESIVNSLPNGVPGSKILISTQLLVVASSSSIHNLSGLSRQDAWYLFCKKAFPNSKGNICPPELKEC